MDHALLNAEGFAATGFLIVLLLRAKLPASVPAELGVSGAALGTAIAVIAALAFWPNLGSPLLHDSYGLVYLPSRQSLGDVFRLFYVHPSSGDFFFRPLAYVAYWLYSKWAHFEPFRWHLGSLILHIANCLLVYALARQLSFAKLAAFTAAVLFAIHGSRPEAVSWAAARVDLLAAFFVLLTLLSLNRWLSSARRRWLVLMVLCALAALLSKESAYCLPFLAGAMLPLRTARKRPMPAFALLLAVCVLVFCYRYWVIGSIGGYGAASRDPAILHFSLLRTLNALFFREWAILFFPIDWSAPPGIVLSIATCFMAALLVSLAAFPSGARRLLVSALAMTIAAALPVEHLLLIGSDLNGARVLYLPVLGLSFFWGLLIQSRETIKAQTLVLTCLLAFQASALMHNLSIWREVALLGQQSCRFIAQQVAADKAPACVENLPAKWKGVYFLNNSFPVCVLLNSGGKLQEPPRLDTTGTLPAPARVFRWDDSTGKFRSSKSEP